MKKIRVSIVLAVALLSLCSLPVFAQGGVQAPVEPGHPWVIYGDAWVEHGDYILNSDIPDCNDQRDHTMANGAAALTSALIARNYTALMPFANSGGYLAGQAVEALQSELGTTSGDLARFLVQIGASPRYANCGTITLVLPPGFSVVNAQDSIRMAAARDDANFSQCKPLDGQQKSVHLCPEDSGPDGGGHVGYSGFIVYNSPGSPVFVFVFKNWSHDRRYHVRASIDINPPTSYGWR